MKLDILNQYYEEIGNPKRVHVTDKCFIIYEVNQDYLYISEAYTLPQFKGDKAALSELYFLMNAHEKTKAVCWVGLDNKNLNINTHLYLSRGAKILNTTENGINFLFEIKE